MKKSTAKPAAAKTPAPATKAEPAVKSTAKKSAAVKKEAAPAPVAKPAGKTVAKPAVKPAAPAAKAKAPKTAAPKPKSKSVAVTTTIVAAVDVGFGNSLLLRGEGPGLSWDVGVPMACVADDRWSITLPESGQPIICKFLINDGAWSAGEDYTVLPGSSVVLSPTF